MTNIETHEILYVDKEPERCRRFSTGFSEEYSVHTAQRACDGSDILKSEAIALVIAHDTVVTDDGAPFLKTVSVVWPHVMGILMTDSRDTGYIDETIHAMGAYAFINTAWSSFDLKLVIKNALETYRLRLVNSGLRRSFNEMDSESLFRGTFDQVAVGMVKADLKGKFVRINDCFCEMVGYSRDELLKITFKEITHPDDLVVDLGHVRDLMDGKDRTFYMEKRYIHKTGRVVWVDLTVSLVRKPNADPDYFIAVIQNTTDRKEMEHALEKSEEAYRDLYENAPVAYCSFSAIDGSVLRVNRSMETLICGNKSELLTKKILDFYVEGPDGFDRAKEIFRKIKNGENVESAELKLKQFTGNPIWANVSVYPVMNENGLIIEGRAVATDISQRKKTESELKESQDRLNQISTTINDVFWMTDLKTGKVIFVSPAYQTIWGRSIKSLYKNPGDWVDAIHPDDRDRVHQAFETIVDCGGYDEEFRIVKPDGTLRWIHDRGYPLKDVNGSVYRLVGVAQDITSNKLAQNEIIERENRYRTLIENLPQKIFLKDRNSIYISCNSGFAGDLQIDPSDIAGKNDFDFFPEDLAIKYREDDQRIMDGWKTVEIEEEYVQEGKRKWVNTVKTPVKDETGNTWGLLGFFWDITEKKQAEYQLQADDRRQKTLLELTQMQDASVSEMLDYALETGIQLTQSQIGYIYFYNEETEELTLYSWSKNVMEECRVTNPQTVYCLSTTGLWGEAVRHRAPTFTNEFSRDHPAKKGFPKGHIPLDRHMNVPVFDQDKIVALIGVGNKESDYDETDIRHLTLLMDGVWRILKRKESEEELRKLNEQLEERVRERTRKLEQVLYELKEREEALGRSETQFRMMMEYAPYSIELYNREGVLIRMNRKGMEMWAEAAPSMITGDFCIYRDKQAIKTGHAGAVRMAFDGMASDIPEAEFIIDIPGCEKRTITLYSKIYPLKDPGGEVRHAVITHEDITARVRAAEALRDSEERYKSMFTNNHAVMFLIEPDTGKFRDVNPAACYFYGYDSDTFRQMHIWDINTLGKDNIKMEMEQARSEQRSYFEFPHRLANGEVRDVEVYSGPIMVHGEKLLYSIIHDITERRRMERKLESELWVNTSIARLSHSIISENLSPSEMSVDILEEARKLTGSEHGYVSEIDPETGDNIGHTLTEMFGEHCRISEDSQPIRFKKEPDGYPALWGHCLNTLKGFYTNDAPSHPTWKGGCPAGHVPIKQFLSVPAIVSGHLVGQIALSNTDRDYEERDLGVIKRIAVLYALCIQRWRRAEELETAKVAAEAANLAKSQFLSTMSHEIRTPLNAIIGMAEALAETELSRDQNQYVEIFHSAGENLLNLVNDILDLSKIEAGQLELESVDFNLEELIESTCDILAVRAHEKGLELICHIDHRMPVVYAGDPFRLRQILVNLIGNGVKFTSQGEVMVTVDTEPPDETIKTGGRVNVRFVISDTGIGIPEEKLTTIFDTFTQVDASTTRKYGGTGLGLSISKRLINMMGGDIRVVSRADTGSHFMFSVRLECREGPEPSEKQTPVDLSGIRVLVVDDQAVNRLVAKETLKKCGALVEEAEDGASCLRTMASANEKGTPFDLVLLDRTMPDMDGADVAGKIQKDDELNKICVVMMTSDMGRSDVNTLKPLGVSRYLVKPIKRNHLIQMVSSALRKKPDKIKSPVPHRTDKRDGHYHILMAEDSIHNQKVVMAYLKEVPVSLDIAENGLIAVDKFKSGSYDLVFMDIQMPEMDGMDATREIRNWEKAEQKEPVPIIALSAHAMQAEVKQHLEAGCSDHLSKPIRKHTFMSMVEKYLEGLQKTPIAAQAPATPKVPDEAAVVTVDPVLLPYVPEFLDSVKNNIDTICQLVSAGDYDTIASIAHKIKGEGGTYGFDQISVFADQLQEAARMNRFADILMLADRLTDYLNQIKFGPS